MAIHQATHELHRNFHAVYRQAGSGRSILVRNTIFSLAWQADFFLQALNQPNIQYAQLVDYITFHDLAETDSEFPDVPGNTAPDIAEETYRTPEQKAREEAAANDRITRRCTVPLQTEFADTIGRLNSLDDDTRRFFQFLDKTDPIIAIWRYIHLFRDRLNIDRFLDAMTDFFGNAKVRQAALDQTTDRMVAFLQSKRNALMYYNARHLSFGDVCLDTLMDGRPMAFVDE
ncbi:MAG: hypothetical protein HY289_16160 [Planctomycetes bacterium]|nr:hypothetical protein [Planctomycetota bacterium]